uniref:CidA/LrgA family protein n=1 Tax=Pararhizobium sp. IMCC3301 TaxID=3067904 RepID=UPI00274148ED|nr:CidA/LrgA family protein [Pararhizobium sp. IMCC3301]
MLRALTLFLACQLFGEFFVRVTALQLPGPLVGMMILLVALFIWSKRETPEAGSENAPVDRTAQMILGNLSLLFVPAAVGIVQHLPLLANHTLALTLTIVGSTLLTLLVSVAVFRLLSASRELS